jgi:NAD-dependent DNA ligase
MSGIVFTGKGIDPRTNNLMARPQWAALGAAKGFYEQKKVTRSTTYLVASRDDTSKASMARNLGVQVISYNDFYAMCKGAAAPTSFNAAPPPPLDTEGMEEIDGWGMF